MKRSRFSEEQIIGILKEHQAGLGAKELCRKHGMASATFYAWKRKYAGLDVSDAKKLKALQDVYAEALKRKARKMGDVVDQHEGTNENGEYELVIKVEL